MLEKSEIAEIERILDRVLPSNDNFKNTPLQMPKQRATLARINIVGTNIVVESNCFMLLTIFALVFYHLNG